MSFFKKSIEIQSLIILKMGKRYGKILSDNEPGNHPRLSPKASTHGLVKTSLLYFLFSISSFNPKTTGM